MAEPIPSANENDEVQKPANAEDRKAAAALDALNANNMGQQENGEPGSKQPSTADQEALIKAMGRLEAVAGGGKTTTRKTDEKKEVSKKEAEAKSKIKLAAADIQFIVHELDLSRPKAMDLLRAHEGDRGKAVRSFVTPVAAT